MPCYVMFSVIEFRSRCYAYLAFLATSRHFGCYITPHLIGWAHTQNNPCFMFALSMSIHICRIRVMFYQLVFYLQKVTDSWQRHNVWRRNSNRSGGFVFTNAGKQQNQIDRLSVKITHDIHISTISGIYGCTVRVFEILLWTCTLRTTGILSSIIILWLLLHFNVATLTEWIVSRQFWYNFSNHFGLCYEIRFVFWDDEC